jgi:hypothetical protein
VLLAELPPVEPLPQHVRDRGQVCRRAALDAGQLLQVAVGQDPAQQRRFPLWLSLLFSPEVFISRRIGRETVKTNAEQESYSNSFPFAYRISRT